MIRVLALLLVLTLTACSNANLSSEQQRLKDFEPGVFQESDLSMYDDENKIEIRMGMSKDDVEAALGEPIETKDFIGVYVYPGIEVHYKENLVNGLLITDNTNNYKKFRTARGVKFGDSEEAVFNNYGLEEKQRSLGDSIRTVTYIVEKTTKGYEVRDSFNEALNKENVFSLSMNIDKNDGVGYIMIADYEFSTNPSGK